MTEASIARAVVAAFAAMGSSYALGQADGTTIPDRVAYSTFAPGNWDIYLFARSNEPPRRLTYVLELARGGEPRRLIDSDALEDQAVFAPDGESIAFVSTAAGNADVYTLRFAPNETVLIGAA